MPKVTDTPRLRTHSRKDRHGNVIVYYFWDGRTTHRPDVALGRDYGLAMQRYRDCEAGIGLKSSRAVSKALPSRRTGKRRNLKSDIWLAVPAWQRTMYFNAERRARVAEKSFRLTPNEFLALIVNAGGKCEVTGLPFELGVSRSPFAPSMDRKDCSKGYELGNVQIVCHIVNLAMNTWGLEPLLRVAEALCGNNAENGRGNSLSES